MQGCGGNRITNESEVIEHSNSVKACRERGTDIELGEPAADDRVLDPELHEILAGDWKAEKQQSHWQGRSIR